jgi:hypothetical protein
VSRRTLSMERHCSGRRIRRPAVLGLTTLRSSLITVRSSPKQQPYTKTTAVGRARAQVCLLLKCQCQCHSGRLAWPGLACHHDDARLL